MCLENPQSNLQKKLVELKGELISKIVGSKVNVKNELDFYMLATNTCRLKFTKLPFVVTSKI